MLQTLCDGKVQKYGQKANMKVQDGGQSRREPYPRDCPTCTRN